MRRPIVAGNWKMHGSQAFVEEFAGAMTGLEDSVDVYVFPPSVYLSYAVASFAATGVKVGVQNVHDLDQGAFTGEVAAQMAADLRAVAALVGHSERRQLFGETDVQVAGKFKAVQRAGMTPVLCVGETLEERRRGATGEIVLGQLGAVLDAVGSERFTDGIVAYEPVWAIGTGETATPDQAQEVHALIRGFLADSDVEMAKSMRLLYGGSVKADNAAALFHETDIDGGLVGGASLDSAAFLGICKAAGN